MFEKEAEELFKKKPLGYEMKPEIEIYKDGFKDGYNKAKEEMQKQIEKMKCCSNCNHFNKESDIEYCQNCERHLVNSLDNFPREEIIKDEWELRR